MEEKKNILIPFTKYMEYSNDSKITIDYKSISIKLLNDLLNDDTYYYYIEKLLNKELSFIHLLCLNEGKIKGSFIIRKEELVKALDIALKNNYLKLEENTLTRYNNIKRRLSYPEYKKSVINQIYEINVDNHDYKIKYQDIFYLLELDFEEFNRFLKLTYFQEIPLNILLYILNNFYLSQGLYHYIDLPFTVNQNITTIINNQEIDILTVNKITKTKDNNQDKIKINPLLEDYILKGLEEENDLLVKALYIYLKLCYYLTYDERYYAFFNQTSEIVKYHENMENVQNITIENNKIVCYEFIAIYAYFLRKLGINYEMIYAYQKKDWGEHSSLTFRLDKFMINVDAVQGVFNGDLVNVKLNRKINGLTLENKNPKTIIEYYQALEKAYALLNLEVKVSDSFIDTYNKLSSTINLPVEERLNILLAKLKEKNLYCMDKISYLLLLKKILFPENTKDFSVMDVCIIRFKNNEIYTALPIITLNPKGINNIVSNRYFTYEDEFLKEISLEEIRNNFDQNIYSYIEYKDIFIPGIEVNNAR